MISIDDINSIFYVEQSNNLKLGIISSYLLKNYKIIDISQIHNSAYTSWFQEFDVFKTFIDTYNFIPNRAQCKAKSSMPYFNNWIVAQYKSQDILIKEIWSQFIKTNPQIFLNFKKTYAYKKEFGAPSKKKHEIIHNTTTNINKRHRPGSPYCIENIIRKIENTINKYPNITMLENIRLSKKVEALTYHYKQNKSVMNVPGSKEKWNEFWLSGKYQDYKKKIKRNNCIFLQNNVKLDESLKRKKIFNYDDSYKKPKWSNIYNKNELGNYEPNKNELGNYEPNSNELGNYEPNSNDDSKISDNKNDYNNLKNNFFPINNYLSSIKNDNNLYRTVFINEYHNEYEPINNNDMTENNDLKTKCDNSLNKTKDENNIQNCHENYENLNNYDNYNNTDNTDNTDNYNNSDKSIDNTNIFFEQCYEETEYSLYNFASYNDDSYSEVIPITLCSVILSNE